MRAFSYTQVDEEGAAMQAAGASEAAYLAGGTTLLDLMKLDVMAPGRLVDVNGLHELARIEERGGEIRLGALATNTDVAYNDVVKSRLPALSEALLSGASPQLRNMATVGGNLMQRTRCAYFRDPPAPCNKRTPGSGCAAVGGYSRMHAVLGGSPSCVATHPSDMCVALAALDAVVHVRSPQGERRIPLVDFHLLPGDHPERETALEHGELILAVTVPLSPAGLHSHYLKARDRASYAFALASVAAGLQVENGTIVAARLALGGVATKPWRAFEAEKMLVGKPPSEGNFRAAATLAVRGAAPLRDNAFKVELAQRLVLRAFSTIGAAS
jgi:xanthine dehydrogenase YagS FAD-binding subunit